MFRRISSTANQNADEENPYLLSFSDIMAGLLGLFILALIAVMIQLDQQRKQLKDATKKAQINAEELHKALDRIGRAVNSIQENIEAIRAIEESRRKLLHRIKEELGDMVPVEVTEEGDVLRIPESTFSFPKGSDEIPPDKRGNAKRIGSVLLTELQRPQNLQLLDTIFVEGHTDSLPNSQPGGNWRLSTDRAISLWRFWTDRQGSFAALTQFKNARSEPLFSVSGYADKRPVVEPPPELQHLLDTPNLPPNAFKQLDEPKNRRIDLRFTLRGSEEVRKKLEQELIELKNLQEQVIKTLKGP
jgi:flagellar motor protein MotB